MPALLMAQRVQEKVARVGFDWEDWQGPREKVNEELDELDCAIKLQDENSISDELGDVFFALINLARTLHVNAEDITRLSVKKFINRFRNLEKLISEEKLDLEKMSLDEMDKYWEIAKVLQAQDNK